MVNVPDFCERGILAGPFKQCDEPPQTDIGRAIFSVWLNSRLLAALTPLSSQQVTQEDHGIFAKHRCPGSTYKQQMTTFINSSLEEGGMPR